jgi:E3 ubiquitin-protein ligase synoviolin
MADSLRPRLQSVAGSVLSHRVFLYSFASTLAVSATVINALQNQSNFYSVAVYLSKSGASVLVTPFYILSTCSNLILLYSSGSRQLWPALGFDVRSPCPTYIFWLFATGGSRGGLAYVSRCANSYPPRKRLYDRMWFFVTESLLAFTIFRDEFDIPLAVMFGFLLFVKSFHWLLADRIEWVRSFIANHSIVYSLSADEPNALSRSDHLVPHTN